MWSTLSEFWGRKVRPRGACQDMLITRVADRQKIYLVSTALCMVGCIVGALSKTINVLIGMRCFQAVGYVWTIHLL